MHYYSPSLVWSILVADASYEGDLDERIDVARGLHQLKRSDRVLLVTLAHGYSGEEAMHFAGIPGRYQTRHKNKALTRLTKIINGPQS